MTFKGRSKSSAVPEILIEVCAVVGIFLEMFVCSYKMVLNVLKKHTWDALMCHHIKTMCREMLSRKLLNGSSKYESAALLPHAIAGQTKGRRRDEAVMLLLSSHINPCVAPSVVNPRHLSRFNTVNLFHLLLLLLSPSLSVICLPLSISRLSSPVTHESVPDLCLSAEHLSASEH